MGLFDRLKTIFSGKSDVKALEQRFKSIEQREPPPSIEPEKPKPIAISTSLSDYEEIQEPETAEIQKTYELGLAAGYTGRSIKAMEASLARIEGQMVTKDWFAVQIEQMDRRIEDIEQALGIVKGALAAEGAKVAVVRKMPLTQRMEQVFQAVKEAGEISFADLALKMDMDVSDLRSLLSVMARRTDAVKRFRTYRAGWIKYVGEADSSA